jgi:hypothetical protein
MGLASMIGEAEDLRDLTDVVRDLDGRLELGGGATERQQRHAEE